MTNPPTMTATEAGREGTLAGQAFKTAELLESDAELDRDFRDFMAKQIRDALAATPPKPAPDALRDHARFLLDRLQEYDPGDYNSERDFHGHVAPAIARLRDHLAASPAPVPPADGHCAKCGAVIHSDDPQPGDWCLDCNMAYTPAENDLANKGKRIRALGEREALIRDAIMGAAKFHTHDHSLSWRIANDAILSLQSSPAALSPTTGASTGGGDG